jgi:superfamily II DNA or RNA helicase
MNLFPYQIASLEAIEAAHREVKRVCYVLPTGGGKSVVATEWARRQSLVPPNGLILAHRIELLRQMQGHLRRAGIEAGILSPEEPAQPWLPVQCASLDTIVSRGEVPNANWIIADECFPAGTLVLMDDGREMPIEELVPGDSVFAGGRIVVASSKSSANMVRLQHGGARTECTSNHPFFVKGRGYVEAKSVTEGDLLCVWRALREGDSDRAVSAEDLLFAVSSASIVGDDERNEQEVRQRSNAVQESHAELGSQNEGIRYSAKNRARPEGEGRKWDRPDRSGVAGEGARSGAQPLSCGSHRGASRFGLPDSLQAGPGSSGAHDSGRGGRPFSLCSIETKTGRKENLVAVWERVDRIEVQEPGGVQGSGARVVYNLQTLGGCYVANRALVHNCHHLPAETYRPVLEALPNAITLGLTATPQRGDGKPLDMFQRLVVGAQYSDLIKIGRICPVKIFRPAEYLGSDFAIEPADAWIKHADGQRGFAFCRSVKAAKELAEELRSRGVRAACVEGRMSEADRTRAIESFREGKIDCLTNVHILTEGVDIPEAVVCMLASSPQHVGTFLQRVGRVLRAAPGKTHAVLIDLPGCSHPDMHSPPTSDREYALEGRAIKAVGESLKNCPKCGLTVPSACRVCECGFAWPRREYKGPKIWNLELLEFFETGGDLAAAPKDLKSREWDRLVNLCAEKSFGMSFAVKEYARQFGESPPKQLIKRIDDAERVKELRRLLSVQQSRGLKPGWISHAYKQTFGSFPSRELRAAAGVPLPASEFAR